MEAGLTYHETHFIVRYIFDQVVGVLQGSIREFPLPEPASIEPSLRRVLLVRWIDKHYLFICSDS